MKDLDNLLCPIIFNQTDTILAQVNFFYLSKKINIHAAFAVFVSGKEYKVYDKLQDEFITDESNPKRYKTSEEAFKVMEEKIKNSGMKLLTQKEYDRLLLLVK